MGALCWAWLLGGKTGNTLLHGPKDFLPESPRVRGTRGRAPRRLPQALQVQPGLVCFSTRAAGVAFGMRVEITAAEFDP